MLNMVNITVFFRFCHTHCDSPVTVREQPYDSPGTWRNRDRDRDRIYIY